VSLLFELAACTDRPVFWISSCGNCCCTEDHRFFPSVLTHCSCEGLLYRGELREEHPPRGSLGCSLCSPL
jgi:hypothetical protein